MLKIINFSLAIVVITVSAYSLITKDFSLMPYMMIALGLFMLGLGISEFQKKQKTNAIMIIFASTFIFFVSIYTF
ncbi:DUF3953 domain-containing protein [Sporosarcina sp. ZBG7A]|uniref:DUF3953 domain-containing protein n=1 Tax=Sporosarcina sp. ZBG7A TaxID=1582223 RepID=UPI00057A671D|nr:DUF3953 domain-containing protein [Sporosarcina sp. ZBG7A]